MLTIHGRSSSHFTRVTRMFAHELGVTYVLAPIFDISSADPNVYAGSPTLKLPALQRDDGTLLFGSENICRALADVATIDANIIWPEALSSDLSRNANEAVAHCMAAQVQLVFGVTVGKLPGDSMYFAKARSGFEGTLKWLDDNLAGVLARLPAERTISHFEVSLFCLVEHIGFRPTVPIEHLKRLTRFAKHYGERAAAKRTPFLIDPQP
ncbi:MAG: glutathione S-transferase N-terminal domain-containing protein [Archangium sp.]